MQVGRLVRQKDDENRKTTKGRKAAREMDGVENLELRYSEFRRQGLLFVVA